MKSIAMTKPAPGLLARIGSACLLLVLGTALAAGDEPLAPPPQPLLPLRPDSPETNPGEVHYKSMQPPVYPPDAAREKVEGTVIVKVLVMPTGFPLGVSVATSSGDARLDDAAVQAVWRWQFYPAVRDGKAIESYALIPVNFKPSDANAPAPAPAPSQ